MTRYFAFLRAINVGGHLVKMDRLRRVFESMGFSNVETFIASGNVIFDTAARSAETLESRIEQQLRKELGYDVATFVRTKAELIAIANYEAFSPSELATAHALDIVFLRKPLDERSRVGVIGLRTEIDDLKSCGREIYWLRRGTHSESTISNAAFGKVIGGPATVRSSNTVKRLMAKYTSSRGEDQPLHSPFDDLEE